MEAQHKRTIPLHRIAEDRRRLLAAILEMPTFCFQSRVERPDVATFFARCGHQLLSKQER